MKLLTLHYAVKFSPLERLWCWYLYHASLQRVHSSSLTYDTFSIIQIIHHLSPSTTGPGTSIAVLSLSPILHRVTRRISTNLSKPNVAAFYDKIIQYRIAVWSNNLGQTFLSFSFCFEVWDDTQIYLGHLKDKTTSHEGCAWMSKLH